MPRFKPYHQTQIVATACLTLMFVVGASALLNPKGNYEWFPFYSWSMFALVPQEKTTYLITVHRVAAPQNNQVAWTMVRKSQSLQEFHLIQKLGRAIEDKESTAIYQLRNTLESNYLKGDFIYKIFRLEADPLKLWHERLSNSGEYPYPESELLAQFKTGAEKRLKPILNE